MESTSSASDGPTRLRFAPAIPAGTLRGCKFLRFWPEATTSLGYGSALLTRHWYMSRRRSGSGWMEVKNTRSGLCILSFPGMSRCTGWPKRRAMAWFPERGRPLGQTRVDSAVLVHVASRDTGVPRAPMRGIRAKAMWHVTPLASVPEHVG
jgi:hypothetical protein